MRWRDASSSATDPSSSTRFAGPPPSDVYTAVLQHFDADGNALSPPVAQPVTSETLSLAVTPSGALASWPSDSSAVFVPLDSTGAESGSVSTVPTVDALYEALASTPSGDILVTLPGEDQTNGVWTIYVQERTSDGSPRGALVGLPNPIDTTDNNTGGVAPGVIPIVAADGVHALIVYVNGGVYTRPLQCAD
jgi:hypothetical protein